MTIHIKLLERPGNGAILTENDFTEIMLDLPITATAGEVRIAVANALFPELNEANMSDAEISQFADETMRLIFAGRELESTHTLEFYGIENNSTIHIVATFANNDLPEQARGRIKAKAEAEAKAKAEHAQTSQAVFEMAHNPFSYFSKLPLEVCDQISYHTKNEHLSDNETHTIQRNAYFNVVDRITDLESNNNNDNNDTNNNENDEINNNNPDMTKP